MRERYAVHHSVLNVKEDVNTTVDETEPELVEAKPEKTKKKNASGQTDTTPGDRW
jgi:hypothetical protein